ncbi:MAG: YkgJ family cysteine cluster protein, partial [Alphaproteobacteria bacterium]|nr:YkgJ family cysteine cluster protein [Alphaproteobacteria bacterium]
MTDRDDPAVAWLVRELRGHLRKRPKRHQVSDAARHADALFDANTASLDTSHLACGPGCGSCCCAQVGAETAEAFSIVRHIRETRDAAQAEDLLNRVRARAGEIAGMDPGQRWEAQKPCVFLHPEKGDCTIYPVRPLACRGYNSTDLGACRTSTETRDHGHPIP